MLPVKRYPRTSLYDEKGIAFVAGLFVVAVLLLLGTTAVMTSTTDLKISTNYKTGGQAFYAAESGVEEARARLRLANPQNPNLITDAYRTEVQWAAYIGTGSNAQGMGYDSGNSMHVQVASLQSALAYPDAAGRLAAGRHGRDGPVRSSRISVRSRKAALRRLDERCRFRKRPSPSPA